MRTAGLSAMRLDNMHEVMAGYVERDEVPGIVYAVSRGDDVHVDTLGRQAICGVPAQRDTIFRISSMTKPVIAAAAMILVEDGALCLGEPVDRLLPELADRRVLKRLDGPLDDTVPAARPITVRDLLTFKLGLGIIAAPPGTYPIQIAMDELELGQGPPDPAIPPPPDEWMRRLATLPLAHQPGEGWMYGTGSDVLGVLIARASSQTLETLLRERIFEPLGMADTGFSVPPDKLGRLATSYGVAERADALEVHDPAEGGQWSRSPAFPSGAGGLVSTIDDYLAFSRMLLGGGRHDGRQVLSPSSIELMTSNHLTSKQRASARPFLNEDEGWGFGVSVSIERGHSGAAPGSYGWSGGLGTIWQTDPSARAALILLTQVNWTSPIYPNVARDFLAAAYTGRSRADRES
jgi:CubicO group peptidase (beta-lactamase class C family)